MHQFSKALSLQSVPAHFNSIESFAYRFFFFFLGPSPQRFNVSTFHSDVELIHQLVSISLGKLSRVVRTDPIVNVLLTRCRDNDRDTNPITPAGSSPSVAGRAGREVTGRGSRIPRPIPSLTSCPQIEVRFHWSVSRATELVLIDSDWSVRNAEAGHRNCRDAWPRRRHRPNAGASPSAR